MKDRKDGAARATRFSYGSTDIFHFHGVSAFSVWVAQLPKFCLRTALQFDKFVLLFSHVKCPEQKAQGARFQDVQHWPRFDSQTSLRIQEYTVVHAESVAKIRKEILKGAHNLHQPPLQVAGKKRLIHLYNVYSRLCRMRLWRRFACWVVEWQQHLAWSLDVWEATWTLKAKPETSFFSTSHRSFFKRTFSWNSLIYLHNLVMFNHKYGRSPKWSWLSLTMFTKDVRAKLSPLRFGRQLGPRLAPLRPSSVSMLKAWRWHGPCRWPKRGSRMASR